MRFEQLEHGLVVEIGVVIVHQLRIRAVVIDNVVAGGDAFGKISLEAIDAHLKQPAQFRLIPFDGARIGKIDERHARLPLIELIHAAIAAPDEESLAPAFVEQF